MDLILAQNNTKWISGYDVDLMLLKSALKNEKFVENFAQEKLLEEAMSQPGSEPWSSLINAARKKLNDFWYGLLKETGGVVPLEGQWKYRASEYLQIVEPFDIVNYYRWNLGQKHAEGDRLYTQHRPKAYKAISAALPSTTTDVDVALAELEAEISARVLAALA